MILSVSGRLWKEVFEFGAADRITNRNICRLNLEHVGCTFRAASFYGTANGRVDLREGRHKSEGIRAEIPLQSLIEGAGREQGRGLDAAATIDVVCRNARVEQEPSHSHILRNFSASSENRAFSISLSARMANCHAASSSG
jgi:hypothetical protein